MSQLIVSNGIVSSSVLLNSGDSLSVLSGGVASDTKTLPNGVEVISAGGVTSGDQVVGGLVRNYGSETGAQLLSGEIDVSTSGGITDSATITGGALAALLGGVASANTLINGQIYALSGGVLSGNLIAGGMEIIRSGGIGRGETISGIGAAADAVESGAVVESSYVLGYAILAAQSGGIVSKSIASGTGEIHAMSGGYVTQNTFEGESHGVAYSGGLVSGNTVRADAQLMAHASGVVEDNLISNNGMAIASAGGLISGNTILDTSQITVMSGGVARGDTLNGSAVLGYVSGGGQAFGEVLSGAAELDVVGSGAMASGTVVESNGRLLATSSGVVSGSVLSAGLMQVTNGGVAQGDTLSSGSQMEVDSGGSAFSETILSGASASVVASGAFLVSSFIFNGATGQIYNGGMLSASTVQGLVQVDNNGVVTGNTISGTEVLYTGAFASSETVVSGGHLEGLQNGVTVTGATVFDGELSVLGNGTAGAFSVVSGSTVSGSNGVLILGEQEGTSGAAAASMVSGYANRIEGGAEEMIQTTGAAASDTIENGSLVVLGRADAISLESSTVYVAGGAALTNTRLTSGSTLTVMVSGGTDLSGDSIDIGAKLQSLQGLDDPSQFTISGNKLTISGQGSQQIQTLTINGTPDQLLQVALIDESTGLFELEEGTPCYCRGTLIDTDQGEVPVEYLKIGDQVRTLRHGFRSIRWIGRRSYSGQFAAGNRDVLPVVFRAGSLGKNLPREDLSVSPLHAMYLDGVLVPAVALVNGRSIVQAKVMDEVAYFHIELESHDVIFANGAESETFVDDGSRGMFHNEAEYNRLYPDAERRAAVYCAPRVEEGARLAAIRQKLEMLSGKPTSGIGPLEGYLDSVTRTRLTGWASNPETCKPVHLQILDRGVVLGEVVANQPRADLARACGFVFEVPGGLSPLERHVLEVRRVDDHVSLANTPWMLDLAEMQPAQAVIASCPSSPLKGYVDTVSRDRLAGWAFSPATPDAPVALQILDNGALVASVVANALRPDVRNAGACSTAQCGFDVLFPAMLSPFTRHVLEVRREQDGTLLGKPHVIEPVGAFDPALEDVVSRAVASVSDAVEQERVLSFLLGQVEKLSQARAQADSGQYERDMQGLRVRRGLGGKVMPPRRRVLVIDSLRPDTGRDAGSCALLSHIQAFQALGYEVSLVAADQMTGSDILWGAPNVKMLVGPVYRSVEDVLRRQSGSFDVVYLHRAENATRYLALVRMHQKKSLVIYNVADLHFLRLMRQAAVLQRPELLARAQRMKLAEYATILQADVVLTHSVAEAEQIRMDVPQANVHVVPWAVPVRGRVPGFAKRSGVVFLGNYAHAPNADAARWLVEKIMPRVWRQDRSVTCFLAGAEMSDSIHALARRGVETLGKVDDLDALFDSVRLSVAPLRFGAGIKGKVLDSFAAGVPCVMTPIAAEGLMLPKGLMDGLVRENADDLAQLILRLHKRPAPHASMSRAGRACVREGWTEAAVQQALATALQPLTRGMYVLAG